MYAKLINPLAIITLLLTSLVIFNSVAAKDVTGNFQVANGVAIYIGLMPAQIVQGHPVGHEESSMHGGLPGGGSPVHLVVTLFDDSTGQRITPQRKELEIMHIADTVSYGNYFSLKSEEPYRIRLKIRLPEREKVVEATFSHNHKPE